MHLWDEHEKPGIGQVEDEMDPESIEDESKLDSS